MESISSSNLPDRAKERSSNARVFGQEALGFGLLTVLSLGLGLLINGRRAHPLPLNYLSPRERLGQAVTRMSATTPAPLPWQPISLEELQEQVMAQRCLSIDARPRGFYQMGHVPRAISLPREDFERSYAKLRPLLEQDRNKPVVVYCSEADCKDSELVAEALCRLGYLHLSVYKEGWEEWSRAGLPQETGHEQ